MVTVLCTCIICMYLCMLFYIWIYGCIYGFSWNNTYVLTDNAHIHNIILKECINYVKFIKYIHTSDVQL